MPDVTNIVPSGKYYNNYKPFIIELQYPVSSAGVVKT